MKKSVLKKTHLSDEGLAVYIALRQKAVHNIDYELYEHIAYLLTGKLEFSSSLLKKIKKGIENLSDLGLINICTATKKGVKLDTSQLYFSTDRNNEHFAPFLILKKFEVYSIMNEKEIKFPMKTLRYFCCVIDSISNGSDTVNYKYWQNVGCDSIAKLAEMALISESAALDYNLIFESKKLITICRAPEGVVDENGKIINGFSNCYGRPEHAQDIEAFQKNRIESSTLNTSVFSKAANKKRSMKQKYNEIVNGKTYPQAELREIHDFFEKQNSTYKRILTDIGNQYRNNELSLEQYEAEINRYKESHDYIDLSPIAEQLNDVLTPKRKSTSHAYRKFYEDDDDSLDALFGVISNSEEDEQRHPKNQFKDTSIEQTLAGFKVNEGLVKALCYRLKIKADSRDSIRHQLKNYYNCSEELIAQYMTAIDECIEQSNVA